MTGVRATGLGLSLKEGSALIVHVANLEGKLPLAHGDLGMLAKDWGQAPYQAFIFISRKQETTDSQDRKSCRPSAKPVGG